MPIESEFAKDIEQPKRMPEIEKKPAQIEKIQSVHSTEISPEEFIAYQETKKQFKILQEFKINNKKCRFGISPDKHDELGNSKKFAVLDENGKNIFPDSESTFKYGIDGYYIGNLAGDKNPEIICWHQDISGFNKSKMIANYYQYNKNSGKYVQYWKDITDKDFCRSEKKEIVNELLHKKSRFRKAFNIASSIDTNVSILSGRLPEYDTSGRMFVFKPAEKDDIVVLFLNNKIYVNKVKTGRLDIEENIYRE